VKARERAGRRWDFFRRITDSARFAFSFSFAFLFFSCFCIGILSSTLPSSDELLQIWAGWCNRAHLHRRPVRGEGKRSSHQFTCPTTRADVDPSLPWTTPSRSCRPCSCMALCVMMVPRYVAHRDGLSLPSSNAAAAGFKGVTTSPTRRRRTRQSPLISPWMKWEDPDRIRLSDRRSPCWWSVMRVCRIRTDTLTAVRTHRHRGPNALMPAIWIQIRAWMHGERHVPVVAMILARCCFDG